MLVILPNLPEKIIDGLIIKLEVVNYLVNDGKVIWLKLAC